MKEGEQTSSVQWWVADIDQHGNPTLADGAHADRDGCEEALYIMARLGLRPEQQRAICKVEIYPPEAKPHGANEEVLSVLDSIGLRPVPSGGRCIISPGIIPPPPPPPTPRLP